jgi:hypothetical protein
MSKTLLVEIPTKNTLPRPNYGLKKSDWLGQTVRQTLSIFSSTILTDITLSFRKGNK